MEVGGTLRADRLFVYMASDRTIQNTTVSLFFKNWVALGWLVDAGRFLNYNCIREIKIFWIMLKLSLNKYIIADPAICHGKPTFKGTRIMVWQVLEMLSAGESVKGIISAFPSLKIVHIRAALEYASSLTRQNYVIVNTADPVLA